jgi:hypothetical protein
MPQNVRKPPNNTSGAYLELLEHLPPIYRAHLEWELEVSPEAVRWAMLAVRRRRESTLKSFLEYLEQAASGIPALPPERRSIVMAPM